MERRFLTFLLVFQVCVAFGLLTHCSYPSRDEPVTWRSKVTLPFVNKTFQLFEAMKLDRADGLELSVDSTNGEGLVSLEKRDTIHHEEVREAFRLKEEKRDWELGPILLQGLKPIGINFPLGALPQSGGTLPKDSPLDLTFQKTIPLLYRAVLDSTTSPLRIELANRSQGLDIGDLVVYFMDDGRILSSSRRLDRLSPGQTAAREMPAAGVTLKNPLQIRVQGVLRSSYTPGKGDTLKVLFSLNGLTCSQVDASDSVIQLAREQGHEFTLLDSGLNAEHIDIDLLSMELNIRNQSEVALNIKGMLENYWNIAYCKKRDLYSIQRIGENADTNQRLSWLTDFSISPMSWQNAQSQKIDLGSGRLFSVWNQESRLSYAKMRFQLVIRPEGKRISLDKSNRLEILFKPSRLDLSGALIKYQEQKIGKKTQRIVGVKLPWKNSIKESLRGNLQFYNARLRMDMQFNMPQGYSISRFDWQYLISSPRDSSQKDSMLATFTDVQKGKRNTLTQSIKRYFNQFSDSLVLENRIIVPGGASVRLLTPSSYTSSGLTGVRISAECAYNIKLDFDWSVEKNVRMVLNNSEWEIPSSLDRIMSAGDKKTQLELTLQNGSNIEMRLFALAASHSFREELFGLSESQVNSAILEKPEGRNFVALFGKDGVSLPAGGLVENQTIILQEEALNKLTLSDSALIRWELRIPKTARGQLRQDDFIKLKSLLTVEADIDMEILLD